MQSPFFVSLIQAEAKKKGVGENSSDGFNAAEIARTDLCFCFQEQLCDILQLSFLSKGLDKLLQLYILYIYS